MSKCEHGNKNTSGCKQCSKLKRELIKCEHGKKKGWCVFCFPECECTHGIVKESCVICRTEYKCEHGRQCKSRCNECLGHTVNKGKCSRCNIPFIPGTDNLQTCHNCRKPNCIHDNKNTSTCRQCNKLKRDLNVCQHNKRKSRCKDCNGIELCNLHKKSACKICRTGNYFCIHDAIKSECIICYPEKSCNNCKLSIMSRKKEYRPYCFPCYCVLNPDIEIKYRYKTKENLLAESIKNMNLTVDFIQDKKIEGGCSKRRPDFLFDLFTHTVIVECDENNHDNYDTTCEIAKLNDTFTDLADRPIILIRFNPDKYDGKSCFDRDGKIIITEWNRRIKILNKELEKAIKFIPEELITVKKLF